MAFSRALPLIAPLALISYVHAQDAATPAKPTEHVLGTVIATDPSAQTITVKEDKTNAEHVILLSGTRTLLKVPPGAKDLKTATRITAADLAVGDRVDVRGNKPADAPDKIAARSVLLMSGSELAAVHQAQAAEWQSATAGVATSVDPAGQKIVFNARGAQGAPAETVIVTPQTEFTRYSAASPGTPAASQLSDIQPGDQLRIIGDKGADGTTITARRIYSGAFRTLNGTIASIAPDKSQIVINNLATKQPMTVALNATSEIQTIPPEMAQMMAARAGGGARPASASTGNSGTPNAGGPPAGGPPPAGGEGTPGGFTHGTRGGDLSHLIERLPKVGVADLKPGQAVVVSGALDGSDHDRLIATHVITGVEPLLQASPARQRSGGGSSQAVGGDWGLGEMSAPQ